MSLNPSLRGPRPSPKRLRRRNDVRDIELPRDLYAHLDVQTEWWYYTGHCETESGLRFGFELAFFKRRTDLDQFGVVPLRLIANPMYAAHFAISEIDRKRFQYDHVRSFGMPLDMPVVMDEDRYDVRIGDWFVTAEGDRHVLHATFADGLDFKACLEPTKAPVFHGLDGNGVSERNDDDASHHFSFTRMKVAGSIARNGRTQKFTGTGWMDREFGTWEQKRWDWFSVQLEDETELMIYHLRDEENGRHEYSHGRFIERDGSSVFLGNEEFVLESTGEWTSPDTGTMYPNGWQIEIPQLKIELQIEPTFPDQELDTRGTSMVVYWEGVCSVRGKRRGRDIRGNSYVELVGYDRSIEDPSLLSFFLGKWFRF